MIWGKTDIVKYLSDRNGYRSYLEICTASTGREFAKIDPSRFDICHRLMYRCPDDFTDGLAIDFRIATLDSTPCVEELHRQGRRYDIILVDPWHEYDSSYRDLKNAISLVSDNGSIVVHDCLPPTDDIISPTFTPGSWCGVTFMAYIDLVTQNKALRYRTIDTDFGCGVIQLCKDIPIDVPAALLDAWKERSGDPKEAFRLMRDNKQVLLRLVSVDEFIAGAEADAAQTS